MPRNRYQQPRDSSADPFLIETLRDLRTAVDRVDTKQDLLKEQMEGIVWPLAGRMTALETKQAVFTEEVKREAQKWGAAGGIITAATACVAALVAVFKVSK